MTCARTWVTTSSLTCWRVICFAVGPPSVHAVFQSEMSTDSTPRTEPSPYWARSMSAQNSPWEIEVNDSVEST